MHSFLSLIEPQETYQVPPKSGSITRERKPLHRISFHGHDWGVETHVLTTVFARRVSSGGACRFYLEHRDWLTRAFGWKSAEGQIRPENKIVYNHFISTVAGTGVRDVVDDPQVFFGKGAKMIIG